MITFWRLLEELFATFPIETATVRVAKPEAPLGGLNETAEVEFTRTRGEML
jgi:dihydroneopterin aldolase